MKKNLSIVAIAFLFTVAVLALGYFSFDVLTTVIFISGFLGGFLIWLFVPDTVSFSSIKAPFWIAFGLFMVHRVEEKGMGFFAKLSEITGVATPEIVSWQIILLLLASVGAWLVIPLLMKRGFALGYYFAWTFFAAMGITELAHFVLPFFTEEPYGYFPGMASVVILAPVAWWGMYKLSRKA